MGDRRLVYAVLVWVPKAMEDFEIMLVRSSPRELRLRDLVVHINESKWPPGHAWGKLPLATRSG